MTAAGTGSEDNTGGARASGRTGSSRGSSKERPGAPRGASVERPGAEHWVPPDGDVAALRSAAPGCRGCELWADATQVVFSSGGAQARLVLVGEQPGDQEDRAGEPFVGPAGRVLDDALREAGIDRSTVYLTNAVKHFRFTPPERGTRRLHKKPAVGHIDACRPWLEAEMAAVRPDVVVCLGATAARAVLGVDVGVEAVRGTVLDEPLAVGTGEVAAQVLVTAHPSAVLRLRGKEGWSEAFGRLVDDLRVAASLVG
jgi:DNA polymerase